MEFLRPAFALFFVFPFLLIIVFLFSFPRKRRRQYYLKGDKNQGNQKHYIFKKLFFILGFSILILSLMGPSWGIKKNKKNTKKTIVFFLIDNSYSMLAEDIYPNRLEKAKSLTMRIIKELSDYDTALLCFAGESQILVPPTKDKENFSNYLMALNPEINDIQGTSYQTVFKSLRRFSCNNNVFFILISDGENFDNGWEKTVREIKRCGSKIFSIGIGTIEGAPIPETAQSDNIIHWKIDDKGETIITKLNTFSLLKISPPPDNYFIVKNYTSDENLIRKIIKSLSRYERTRVTIIKPDRTSFFLLFAIIIFLIYGVFFYEKK